VEVHLFFVFKQDVDGTVLLLYVINKADNIQTSFAFICF